MEPVYNEDCLLFWKGSIVPKRPKDQMLEKVSEILSVHPEVINEAYPLKDRNFFSDIFEYAIAECKKIQNNNHNTVLLDSWVNVVRTGNANFLQPSTRVKYKEQDPVWHDHKTLNESANRFTPDFTFVYYLQIPNNLKEYDGMLLIKGDNGFIYEYLPKENDLIIMRGHVPHSVLGAPDSTLDRIVIACNVGLRLEKQTKTVI